MTTVSARAKARWLAASLALLLALGGGWWWYDDQVPRFLPADTTAFVATFSAPPAADSAQTRSELAELLMLQEARNAAEVEASRADRKKNLTRFYDALGLASPHSPLPRTERLAERVEDDVSLYVRAAKKHFRRLRPYVVEPRLEPCVGNVQGDLSYPSGHSAYGWSMAYLLTRLVPERKEALEIRAREFARQRLVCGVHFPSDLDAGRQAAEWLLDALDRQPEFQREAAEAADELRAALKLPARRR